MVDNKRVISFSPPDISELEIAEVSEALRSGWITTGPRTKQLEKNIAEWIGTEGTALKQTIMSLKMRNSIHQQNLRFKILFKTAQSQRQENT